MQIFIAVGLGGFLGANARYWLSQLMITLLRPSTDFAALFATGMINITGSALLGFFLATTSHHIDVPDHLRLFVATGFFGAYTTFSTFSNESVSLAMQGEWKAFLIYVSLTNVLCILGAVVGIAVARWLAA